METLDAQYQRIKKQTNLSHVIKFGDMSISQELVTNFEGNGSSPPAPPSPTPPPPPCPNLCRHLPKVLKCLSFSPCAECPDCQLVEEIVEILANLSTGLPSADAALSSAFYRFLKTGSTIAADELMHGVKQRRLASQRFNEVSIKVAGVRAGELGEQQEQFHQECHYAAYRAYTDSCGEWDAEALAHSATLAKLCQQTQGRSSQIVAAIVEACV